MISVFPNKKVLEQEYKDLSGLLSNIVDSVPMYLFVKDTGNISGRSKNNSRKITSAWLFPAKPVRFTPGYGINKTAELFRLHPFWV